MDRPPLSTAINKPLTANRLSVTLTTGYRRLCHPATGRFVGEYDPERGLLRVVDRGKTAVIDLRDAPAG